MREPTGYLEPNMGICLTGLHVRVHAFHMHVCVCVRAVEVRETGRFRLL